VEDLLRDNQKLYFCHCPHQLWELFFARVRKVYSFNFGTESWVEHLDTEGLESVSSYVGAGLLMSIDCHLDVVIFSRSLKRVWSDGTGLPSRWYIGESVVRLRENL
jgi:hypothetical protein